MPKRCTMYKAHPSLHQEDDPQVVAVAYPVKHDQTEWEYKFIAALLIKISQEAGLYENQFRKIANEWEI